MVEECNKRFAEVIENALKPPIILDVTQIPEFKIRGLKDMYKRGEKPRQSSDYSTSPDSD